MYLICDYLCSEVPWKAAENRQKWGKNHKLCTNYVPFEQNYKRYRVSISAATC